MPGARPTKLSQARVDAICDSIRTGVPYETAAKAAGIVATTLWRWRETGEAVLDELAEDAEKPKAKRRKHTDQDLLAARLCTGIEKAEADAELAMVQVVRSHALGAPAEYDDSGNVVKAEVPSQWQPAMTYLERKYPDRWSRRINVKDETPRDPQPVDEEAVAGVEARFREAWGAELDEIPDTNRLDPIAGLGIGANGSGGNGAGP